MRLLTPSFEWPALHRRRLLATALFGCAALPACAAPSQPAQPKGLPGPAVPDAPSITGITLERDCNGCPTGMRLVLRRGGSAEMTQTGKARLGTQDQVAHARLLDAEFDKLAQAVVAAGFFAMADTYQEPDLQDGTWSTLSVDRGSDVKQVFRREDAGPAALKALEAAVLALQAKLRFVPVVR